MRLYGAGAMQPSLGLKVSGVGLFGGVVGTKTNLLSSHRYFCHPPFFVWGNAEKTTQVLLFGYAQILFVLAVRHISQVMYAVIERVPVNVVDLLRWVGSVNIQPGDPVQEHSMLADGHFHTPAADRTCGVTGLLSSGANAPSENPGFWVVVQKFANAFCGKISFSHAVSPVKKWFGQRPDGVSALAGFRHFSLGVA